MFDERRLEEKLKNYDWRDFEEALREVQYGICMLSTYFSGCGKPDAAAAVSIAYTIFADLAKFFRKLMEEEELLSPEDHEEVEERMRSRGHVLDDAVRG